MLFHILLHRPFSSISPGVEEEQKVAGEHEEAGSGDEAHRSVVVPDDS